MVVIPFAVIGEPKSGGNACNGQGHAYAFAHAYGHFDSHGARWGLNDHHVWNGHNCGGGTTGGSGGSTGGGTGSTGGDTGSTGGKDTGGGVVITPTK